MGWGEGSRRRLSFGKKIIIGALAGALLGALVAEAIGSSDDTGCHTIRTFNDRAIALGEPPIDADYKDGVWTHNGKIVGYSSEEDGIIVNTARCARILPPYGE